MSDLTPREIVSELDRFIIGQKDAKRAVAIALRNRWRRMQLPEALREEVLPKNILMIGPTGVGKTEIARRLARLAGAPFIKVEATKFTEVGYVGRDVETIIRDLVEAAIIMIREKRREEVRVEAESAAEERVLTALIGDKAGSATKEKMRQMLRSGQLDDKEIDLEITDTSSPFPMMELPGGMGTGTMMNLGELFSGMGKRTRKRKMKVSESHAILVAEEADKLLDQETLTREALHTVEQNGIVFIDEIDKVCARSDARGADVSREGVQRDLLPLIEGQTVSTKHGAIKTDHILFIASGAFHIAKPSDLLPELQGRLPIRVELSSLGKDDFKRILIEPEASLIKQYTALMQAENVALEITEDGIESLAEIATDINENVENIGARRLHAVLEKVLEDLSFQAPDQSGQAVQIDRAYVEKQIGEMARNTDLSRFIL